MAVKKKQTDADTPFGTERIRASEEVVVKLPGKLITVESIDPFRKNKVLLLLVDLMIDNGVSFTTVQALDDPVLRHEALWGKGYTPLQRTMLLSLCLDRSRVAIEKALQGNQVVVCDRGRDSFFAYQGFGDQLLPEVWTLGTIYKDFPTPDLTLYLRSDPHDLTTRQVNKQKDSVRNYFEKQTAEYYMRVEDGYRFLSNEFDRIRTIPVTVKDIELRRAVQRFAQPCFDYIKNKSST